MQCTEHLKSGEKKYVLIGVNRLPIASFSRPKEAAFYKKALEKLRGLKVRIVLNKDIKSV